MHLKFIIIFLAIIALPLSGFFLLNYPYFDWKPNRLSSLSKNFCEILGGEMKAKGCGIAGCAYKCKFAYKDGDKPCQTSKECSGKCIVTKPYIYHTDSSVLEKCKKENDEIYDCSTQNFQTQCQKWPQENCDPIWEYNKGKIRLIFGECSI